MSYTVNNSDVKENIHETTISQSRVQTDGGAAGEQWRETSGASIKVDPSVNTIREVVQRATLLLFLVQNSLIIAGTENGF